MASRYNDEFKQEGMKIQVSIDNANKNNTISDIVEEEDVDYDDVDEKLEINNQKKIKDINFLFFLAL